MSRFNIGGVPFDSGGEDIARHPGLVSQTANQFRVFPIVWEQPRDRLSPFGYDQSFGIEVGEQRQALLLELCRTDHVHLSATWPIWLLYTTSHF
ncbi:MAG: hypothetical protein OXJ56_18995 [Rhodospirillaceae bacterium]|nr:hypothetical protein [Rhodospirillaceae bacterium]